jgi:hypothetical protein
LAKYPHAADFISGYFTNTFQVAPEPHAVRLDLNIPYFTDPVANQGTFIAEVNNHLEEFWILGGDM